MATDTVYFDLLGDLKQMPTIDAHEHLSPEPEYLERPRDFYTLFGHYCKADLVAAGASSADIEFFKERTNDLGERWRRFSPFYSRIRTGSYARAAQLSMRDILGFDDLNDDTYEAVSLKMQELGKPGLYHKILHDHCNLSAVIGCGSLGKSPYPDNFYHLAMAYDVVNIIDSLSIERLEARSGQSIHTLRDVLTCMDKVVAEWRANPKVVGVKIGHAYFRTLAFKKRTFFEAEQVFNSILTHEQKTLSVHEFIPLNDFLIFEMTARAEAAGLPVAIHTGLQAGNYYRITDANPLLLQDLLLEFPKAKFDLFHGGMPWVREIAVLAKYFPHVYLNMAWMHIISPEQSRSALSEWLDVVPNHKIFGFGGDYDLVEKVYGHLYMARENIAAVLAAKVERGTMSMDVARLVARRLMYENPGEFYGIS